MAPAHVKPKPVYVLVGDDAFLLGLHRRRVVEQAVEGGEPQLCVVMMDSSAELAEVLDELRTLPLLAPRRVVVVSEAEAFISAHREALERFLESAPAHASLVLMVSSWPSNTRLAKLVARIGEAVDCSAPKAADLPEWAAGAAEQRGKQLDRDAAELLAEWIGRDLGALDGEMEKLTLYAGDRPAITLADVCALATASAGPAPFDLTNAITVGDAAAALKALGGMLQVRGDEFKTLGLIAWHLRRALTAKELLAAGQPPQQVVPPMPYAQRAAFLAMLQRRPPAAFHRDFRSLIRADLAMKSGAEPAAALQELVVRLCA